MMSLSQSAPFVSSRGRDLIAVAPLRLIGGVIAETGAADLVSVLNAHLLPQTPAGIAPDRHLKLAVSDQIEADGGSRHPFAATVEELMAFAGRWDRSTPLLIHCFSGLNRSTAAAYIVLCGLNPGTPETLIAHRLRQGSDTASPNRMMVAVADNLFGRGGNMVRALDAIGAGSPSAEGKPFLLPVALDARLPGAERHEHGEVHDIAVD